MQHMTQGAFVQLQATCFTFNMLVTLEMFHEGISRYFSMLMQSFLMLARAQNSPKTYKKLTAFHLKTKLYLDSILVFKQDLKDSINDKQDNLISQPRQY